MIKKISVIISILIGFFTFSQEVELRGEVYSEYLDPFPNALIKLSNGKASTSDYKGAFTIKTELPVTITVSSIGYSSETLEVNTADENISLILKENSGLEQIVISPSRTPERLFESPSAVERISLNQIRETPSVTFFESLENLKNVDLKTNSILLKTINTKGFNTLQNKRVVQLIDGFDNVMPGAGISPGNMIGLVDMDVENVELLQGASSALYGPNALNGVLLIKSKNPFDYEGVSLSLQGGITSQESGSYGFYNPSIRLAYKFNDKFAGKVSFSHYTGEEWHANDTRNTKDRAIIEDASKTRNDSYDGVNTYGDEFKINLKAYPFHRFMTAKSQSLGADARDWIKLTAKADNTSISRDGYAQNDLVDNRTRNIKFNSSLHYRPFGNEKLEISWSSRFNTVTNLFNYGSSKFVIKDATPSQHMLQIKGQNFFLNGSTTYTDLGNSYNIGALGTKLNEKWKKTTTTEDSEISWITDYFNELNNEESYQEARSLANLGKIKPGTAQFTTVVNDLKNTSTTEGGVKFHDQSELYKVEGYFNFGKYIDFIEPQIGGSYKKYVLNSVGFLTTHENERINVDEYGVYAQIRKKMLDDRLSLIASLRYDKSTNFDGVISPRTSIAYIAGKNRNHNFRVSVQQAHRQPNMQEQYDITNTGFNSYSIGSTTENFNRFKGVIKRSRAEDDIITGADILTTTMFTKKSFDEFSRKLFKNVDENLMEYADPGEEFKEVTDLVIDLFPDLKTIDIKDNLKHEQVLSFEGGYRGIINLTAINFLEVDVNGYYNKYKDFIRNQEVYIYGDTYGDGSKDSSKGDWNHGEFADATKPKPYELPKVKDLYKSPYALAVFAVLENNRATISIPKNSEATINAYGMAVSLSTRVFDNYKVGASYAWNDFNYKKNEDLDYQPEFNTSKHNVKLMIGNQNVIYNLGFNMAARWQSGYYWYSQFAQGQINARTVVDGQITFNVPKIKSKFRLGGSNLLGKSYYDNIGNGKVGSIYYLSWIIND